VIKVVETLAAGAAQSMSGSPRELRGDGRTTTRCRATVTPRTRGQAWSESHGHGVHERPQPHGAGNRRGQCKLAVEGYFDSARHRHFTSSTTTASAGATSHYDTGRTIQPRGAHVAVRGVPVASPANSRSSGRGFLMREQGSAAGIRRDVQTKGHQELADDFEARLARGQSWSRARRPRSWSTAGRPPRGPGNMVLIRTDEGEWLLRLLE